MAPKQQEIPYRLDTYWLVCPNCKKLQRPVSERIVRGLDFFECDPFFRGMQGESLGCGEVRRLRHLNPVPAAGSRELEEWR